MLRLRLLNTSPTACCAIVFLLIDRVATALFGIEKPPLLRNSKNMFYFMRLLNYADEIRSLLKEDVCLTGK